MDKQQIVAFIEGQLATGRISKSDLAELAGIERNDVEPTSSNSSPIPASNDKKGLNIFYIMGSVIVILGVVILISANWTSIGALGRISITAGIALLAYAISMFLNKEHQTGLSKAMMIISALLLPLGAYVIITEYFTSTSSMRTLAWQASLIISLVYAVASWAIKQRYITLFVASYLSGAYLIFSSDFFSGVQNSMKWSVMILGAALIIYTYLHDNYIKVKNNNEYSLAQVTDKLSKFFYSAGSACLVGAVMSFKGIGDLMAIPIIFGIYYLSAFVKSRGIMLIATGSLIAYVIKIKTQYFQDNMNMALSLIIIGILIILIGYGMVLFDRKYLKK